MNNNIIFLYPRYRATLDSCKVTIYAHKYYPNIIYDSNTVHNYSLTGQRTVKITITIHLKFWKNPFN
jgi:hypothetical protein